jgi:hypothetical protein
MSSPIRSPEGNWWDHPVAPVERKWLGASLVTAVILFGWMLGWSHVGEQNPTGRSPCSVRVAFCLYAATWAATTCSTASRSGTRTT